MIILELESKTKADPWWSTWIVPQSYKTAITIVVVVLAIAAGIAVGAGGSARPGIAAESPGT